MADRLDTRAAPAAANRDASARAVAGVVAAMLLVFSSSSRSSSSSSSRLLSLTMVTMAMGRVRGHGGGGRFYESDDSPDLLDDCRSIPRTSGACPSLRLRRTG